MRKCEQQVENVYSMVFSRPQPNTKKYFPFPKIVFLENILHEPNTA